ncbi:MAG TPA: MarR family transcriptional regulator [Streptosporangiaceae bacterium]|nr:MarR family transcriptional regulator [Streptosporangiaceae bacterium]
MRDESGSAAWSAVLAVQRAAHASVRVLTAELADLGLTGSELNALANLAGDRARTVSQLAAAAGVRASTMTSVLDRLEARGLVTRGSAPGDRRAVQVRLTAGGRDAATAITAAVAGMERRALAGLPPGALAALHAGLDALAQVAP